jgi:hypothetical protein
MAYPRDEFRIPWCSGFRRGYSQDRSIDEYKGKVLKPFSGQILCVHHNVRCIDSDLYGSGHTRLRSRSDPSCDSSEDQSSGGKGEQIGLAHLILLSVTSAYDAMLHAFCIVPMPRAIAFRIVCVDARILGSPQRHQSISFGTMTEH